MIHYHHTGAMTRSPFLYSYADPLEKHGTYSGSSDK